MNVLKLLEIFQNSKTANLENLNSNLELSNLDLRENLEFATYFK